MLNSQTTTDKLTINVPELAKLLGISRPVAYELTKREGFPAIRIGERRIIIPVDKLNEWLDREAERA
ncbi:MAG: helix-turn-helix domain-containing protein [Clostridia bacterium]|nr:helix-turn-helix domain-containing protein [Clostridia bacterium]